MHIQLFDVLAALRLWGQLCTLLGSSRILVRCPMHAYACLRPPKSPATSGAAIPGLGLERRLLSGIGIRKRRGPAVEMHAIGKCSHSSRPLGCMRPPARVGRRGHPGPGPNGGAIRAGGRNGCENAVRRRQQRSPHNFINSSIFSSRAPQPKHQLPPGWASLLPL